MANANLVIISGKLASDMKQNGQDLDFWIETDHMTSNGKVIIERNLCRLKNPRSEAFKCLSKGQPITIEGRIRTSGDKGSMKFVEAYNAVI